MKRFLVSALAALFGFSALAFPALVRPFDEVALAVFFILLGVAAAYALLVAAFEKPIGRRLGGFYAAMFGGFGAVVLIALASTPP